LLASAPAGLPAWTARDRPVARTDLVLWHVVGMHHLPRTEDWPVMPLLWHAFELRPFDFFDRNPALDLPRQPYSNAEKVRFVIPNKVRRAFERRSRSISENQEHGFLATLDMTVFFSVATTTWQSPPPLRGWEVEGGSPPARGDPHETTAACRGHGPACCPRICV